MARSRMSVIKRQRELKKAEKAAQKRAKRHGIPQPTFSEPKPTVLQTAKDVAKEKEDDEVEKDGEES